MCHIIGTKYQSKYQIIPHFSQNSTSDSRDLDEATDICMPSPESASRVSLTPG